MKNVTHCLQFFKDRSSGEERMHFFNYLFLGQYILNKSHTHGYMNAWDFIWVICPYMYMKDLKNTSCMYAKLYVVPPVSLTCLQ